MNNTSLIFAVFSVLVGVLFFSSWSNTYVYAQQSSSPTASSSTPSTSAAQPVSKPQQHMTKIKLISPTKGQQVPIGKDITITGTSIDSASANDCKVSVIVNKVRPYQPTTPTGTGGGGAESAANDYSKWNFVLTSKYTTIKPGQNRITAKYECVNNPALTSFSSINVTGVSAAVAPSTRIGSGTSIVPQLVNGTNQRQQISAITQAASQLPKQTGNNTGGVKVTTTNVPIVLRPLSGGGCPSGYHLVSGVMCIKDVKPTTATAAPVSNIRNKSLLSSSQSTITPQVNAINKQQQQQQQQQRLLTISNGTAGQNYTFASTSPVVGSGKLMYLGFHGDSGGSTEKTSTKSSSDHSNHGSSSSNDNKGSSDNNKSSSDHSNHGSKSSSSSSSSSSF